MTSSQLQPQPIPMEAISITSPSGRIPRKERALISARSKAPTRREVHSWRESALEPSLRQRLPSRLHSPVSCPAAFMLFKFSLASAERELPRPASSSTRYSFPRHSRSPPSLPDQMGAVRVPPSSLNRPTQTALHSFASQALAGSSTWQQGLLQIMGRPQRHAAMWSSTTRQSCAISREPSTCGWETQ